MNWCGSALSGGGAIQTVLNTTWALAPSGVVEPHSILSAV